MPIKYALASVCGLFDATQPDLKKDHAQVKEALGISPQDSKKLMVACEDAMQSYCPTRVVPRNSLC